MKQPRQYSRRILLVSTGTSPQVLTETFYELVNQGFIPTEVHLISTSIGAEKANKLLLEVQENKSESVYVELCKQLRITPPRFDKSCIHTIADASGQELEDIKIEKDNQAAADFIVNKVREFTLDEDSALHVSIAGGRKTMGYYTGYALSLYGRMQDRLSHVLVSEGFENNPCFYFPTNKKIKAKPFDKACKEELDASQAEILLADIPFVRMRDDLPDYIKQEGTSYREAVDAAKRQFSNIKVELNLEKKLLYIDVLGDDIYPVKLGNLELAYYLMYCQDMKNNPEEAGFKLPIAKHEDGIVSTSKAYLRAALSVAGNKAFYNGELGQVEKDFLIENFSSVSIEKAYLKHGIEKPVFKSNFFSDRRSVLKKAIQRIMSETVAERLLPGKASKSEGNTDHKIFIEPKNITIIYHDGTKA